jgi:uncharacterized membrane protein
MEEGATEPGRSVPRSVGPGRPTHPIRASVQSPFFSVKIVDG